jgi:Ni/Co efflux regulator RcnB
MTAPHPHSRAARLVAAMVTALTLGLGLALAGGATPANADASQWTRSQPHWWDQSNGWRHHHQWHKRFHQRRHFNHFNNGFGPRVVFGGSGVFFSSPRFVIANPAFIVRQPRFVVRQPPFIVRQPGFIVGAPVFVVRQPNFIFERPGFVAKQKDFFRRHPSLQLGQPWRHKHGMRSPMGQGGARFIRPPGMN